MARLPSAPGKPRDRSTLQGLGNRRLAPRRPIPVRILVVPPESQGEPFWAVADSLSADGVFVQSNSLLPMDSRNHLMILTGNQEPLWTPCRVVHVIPGVGFGCKFCDMAPEMATLLSRWLAAATPTAHAVAPAAKTRARRLPTIRWGF